MQDLSKMSLEELMRLAGYNPVRSDTTTPAFVELTRRMTPPEGHVRLPDGRDVRLTNPLPVTADGYCPIETPVYHPTAGECCPWMGDRGRWFCWNVNEDMSFPVGDCYSTPEAAEAARAKEAK